MKFVMDGEMTTERRKGKIGTNITIIQLSDSVSVGHGQHPSWKSRLISPADFVDTIKRLRRSHLMAAAGIGLGNLDLIGCTSVYDDVCSMMVRYLDPLNERVTIHGKQFDVRPSDFSRIMGIRDGVEDVELSGSINDVRVLSLRKYLAIGNGEVDIHHVKNLMLERHIPDDTFKVAYALYALSTLLCPNGSNVIDQSLVFPLVDTDKINQKNWASFCYTKLMESVMTMQSTSYRQDRGCMLFLQVFYFEAVALGSKWVDKQLTPLHAWMKKDVMKLLLSIEKHGVSWQQNEPKTNQPKHPRHKAVGQNSGAEKLFAKNMEAAVVDVNAMYAQLVGMEERVGGLEPAFVKMAEAMEDMKTMLHSFKKDAVENIVEQVISRLGPANTANGATKEGYDFKSDANFAEAFRESEGHCNEVPNHLVPLKKRRRNHLPDEVRSFKRETKRHRVQSKCSRSPNGPPKLTNRGMKEKIRRGNCTASLQIRKALFTIKRKGKAGPSRTTSPEIVMGGLWGGPFQLRPDTSTYTVNLLNFLFMPRPLTQYQSRFDNELVASCDGWSVTRSDLECLRPETCLDDIVINLFASYLNGRDSVDWYFPTYFSASATCTHQMLTHEEWIKNASKLSKLDRFRWRMKDARQIFIPMHDSFGKGHWYLLVVSQQSGHAIIADSYPGGRESIRAGHATKVLKMLDFVFEDEIKLDLAEGFQFANLECKYATKIFPIQKNDFDCGVYVIRNMQHYLKKWDTEYVSNDHRASLAVECVKHGLNELYDFTELVRAGLQLPNNGE